MPRETELANQLSEKGVKVFSEPPDSNMPGFLSVLISWFPMLLFIGVWIFYETNAGLVQEEQWVLVNLRQNF